MFALSSHKLVKYQYLIDEDLASKPNIIEQKRFEYSPLGKACVKQTKTI